MRSLRWCAVAVLACGSALVAVPASASRPLPRVSVGDVEVTEGEVARVAITLDHPAGGDVRVRLDTRSDTATGPIDYVAVHAVVEIPAGRTRVVVPVTTVADGLDEARESFRVRLSDPARAALDTAHATVTVRDADPLPGVAPQDATIMEPDLGNRIGYAEVRLSAASGRRIVVQVAQRPGTARAGDFVPLEPVVVFEPGETSAVVRIEVLADDRVEGPETLRLVVTDARHARATRKATVTIDDADSNSPRGVRMAR